MKLEGLIKSLGVEEVSKPGEKLAPGMMSTELLANYEALDRMLRTFGDSIRMQMYFDDDPSLNFRIDLGSPIANEQGQVRRSVTVVALREMGGEPLFVKAYGVFPENIHNGSIPTPKNHEVRRLMPRNEFQRIEPTT